MPDYRSRKRLREPLLMAELVQEVVSDFFNDAYDVLLAFPAGKRARTQQAQPLPPANPQSVADAGALTPSDQVRMHGRPSFALCLILFPV